MKQSMPLSALLVLSMAPAFSRADETWTGDGVVVSKLSVGLRTRSPQTVVAVLCDIGDRVKQGQVLVRFDDRQARAERALVVLNVKKKEIECKQAEAKASVARASVDRQKADTERVLQLVKSAVVSTGEVDRAQAELKRALAEVALAETQIEMARLEVDVARAQLELEDLKIDHLTMRAPFEGMVVARNCAPGETIASPENPLVQLMGGPYLVELAMPERLLSAIKVKHPVEVIVGEKTVKAEIALVAAVSDPQNRAFKVQVTLPGDAQSLVRPGMVVRVRAAVKE